MNLFRPCAAICCVAVLFVSRPAQAAPDEKPDRAARREAMLKKFDANGDGKLDAEEREKMRAEMGAKGGRGPERMKKLLEKFDKDGDGKLSEDERAALREAMKGRRGKAEKQPE